MKMNDVRSMAKNLDIKTFGKSKAALIREVQRKQGNFDCFGSAGDFCDQNDCVFRSACLSKK
ncbi:MAG: hypothetical protein P4L43_13380 [Syntrophobacteraceae bacterium]|nr:hypothetical protein [Syntrophobacteraceae bacterium]